MSSKARNARAYRAAACAASLLSFGCSSIPTLGLSTSGAAEEQAPCEGSDWARVGLSDGSTGAPRERLFEHAERCQAHGVPMDRVRYLAGYALGIRRYCQPQHAYELGQRGEPAASCPAALQSGFATGYGLGLDVYCTSENAFRIGRADAPYAGVCPETADRAFLNGLDRGREANRLEQKLTRLDADLTEARRNLPFYRLHPEGRREFMTRMRGLRQDRRELKQRLDMLLAPI